MFHLSAVALCVFFVVLGVVFALIGVASSWGGGQAWAQLVLFFGGSALAAVAAVGGLVSLDRSPALLVPPMVVLVVSCTIARAAL